MRYPLKRRSLFLLGMFWGAGTLLYAQSLTRVNEHGETEILTRERGRLVRQEIRLLAPRELKLAIPDEPRFTLVLVFPDGRSVSEEYRRRVLLTRTTGFTSGMTNIETHAAGKLTRRVIHYPAGQTLTTEYHPNGKKRQETALQKNGTRTDTWYDSEERRLRIVQEAPGGDKAVRLFADGLPVSEEVETPQGEKISRRFGETGQVAHALHRYPDGRRKESFHDRNGRIEELVYQPWPGWRVSFKPGFRESVAVTVVTEREVPVALRYREHNLFEDQLFVQGETNLVFCLPAVEMHCRFLVGERLVRSERWINRVLRGLERPLRSPAGEEGVEKITYNEYGKPLHGERDWPGGRRERIVWHANRVETEESLDGRLVRRLAERPGGSSTEQFYTDGKLVRDVLVDPGSHVAKLVNHYADGVVVEREEYQNTGRLVRTWFDRSGKQTRMRWERWEPGGAP